MQDQSGIRVSKWLTLVSSIALVSTVHAQTALTPQQLTLQLESLTETNAKIQEVMIGMREQINGLRGGSISQGRPVENRAVLDMIQQVDVLADEVSQLNGVLEQHGFDLDQIKRRQRELYLDIDRRLRDIESRGIAQAPTQAIDLSQIGAPTVEQPLTVVTQPPTTPKPVGSVSGLNSQTTTAITPSSNVVSPTRGEEQAAYQQAFDTLKEGRYKKAKTQLSTFLGNFPDSRFAGNAQYWLGEAHYVTRNFDQGITEFEKVLQLYPSSNKVPDAMLKLGYTYYELKKFPEAKGTLNLLREKFPKLTASRLAAKRLERIRKEGN